MFHERTSGHTDAVAMETQLGLGRTVAEEIAGIERKAMIGKFKCLYWLCKEEVAHTTKFESLLSLASNLGVEYLSGAQRGRNAQYTSRDFLQDALQSISDTISRKVLSDVKQSPHFSLMIDETTDVAVLKELIVYAKYLDCNKVPTTSFIGVAALPNGQADTIHETLKRKYQQTEGLNFQVRCSSSEDICVPVHVPGYAKLVPLFFLA